MKALSKLEIMRSKLKMKEHKMLNALMIIRIKIRRRNDEQIQGKYYFLFNFFFEYLFFVQKNIIKFKFIENFIFLSDEFL